ncbi:MAG TPA: hypothetical protein PKE25_11045, partial [Novosphingobium sp.]|nr:hypothetical protein [Novosphingobium sp.]
MSGLDLGDITAATDIELITSGSNGGSISGGTLTATGGRILADSAGGISLDAGTAGGAIGLHARDGDIAVAGALDAGEWIAAVAPAGGISLGSATAGGDLGLRAGAGSITAGSLASSGSAALSASASILAADIDASGDLILSSGDDSVISGVDGLVSGGSIGVSTGGDLSLGQALANGGSLSLSSGGVLTLGEGYARSGAQLSGTSVRVGELTADGLASSGSGTVSLGPVTFTDPLGTGVEGTIPLFGLGASGLAAGDIVITATDGDITGLAVDPLDAPLLARVSTGSVLSDKFGAARLTAARDITATAAVLSGTAGGSVQLGTVEAGRNLTVTGDAVSLADATATTGNLTVTARLGTLVLGTGAAGLTARLDKQGNADAAGNDLRIGSLTAAEGAAFADLADGNAILIDSATGVLAQTIAGKAGLGGNGAVTVIARGGDVELATSLDGAGDVIVDASLAARLGGPVTAAGSLALKAGTAIGGIADGAKAGVLTAGEDLGLLAGTSITLSDATAGDDLTALAVDAISADALTSTGLGALGRSITLPAVGFGAETAALAGSNVVAQSTAGSLLAGSISANAGAVSGRAVAVDVAATSASGGVSYTATGDAMTGTAALGAVTAGGDYRVNAGGTITLGRTGHTAHSANGAVDLVAGADIAEGVAGVT